MRHISRISWDWKLCLGLAMFVLLAGCTDKAEPNYKECIQLQLQGDLGGAWAACTMAMNLSPNSKAGKSAAVKLEEMKPKYAAWKVKHDKEIALEKAAAEKALVRLQAKCPGRLKEFVSAVRNDAFNIPSLGLGLRDDVMLRKYNECVESCATKGIDCKERARDALRKFCDMAPPECLETGNRILSGL